MQRLALGCIMFVALVGMATAQDLSTIQANNDRFGAALKVGDIETVAQLYTEDARIYPPGAEMMQGREAIKAFWTEAAKGVSDAKLTAVEVKPLGDSDAREVGKFSLTTKGDSPMEISGKYVVIWHKDGDEWKIADDIWNMNK